MKKVIVKKQGAEVQHVIFEDDKIMNDWAQMLADTAAWGKPERWVKDSPLEPLTEEQKLQSVEVRDVDDGIGNIEKEYKFLAEYEVVIEDITLQVEAEKAAREAKKLAKESRKSSRLAIDWAKVDTVAELKVIVKNLVEELEDE